MDYDIVLANPTLQKISALPSMSMDDPDQAVDQTFEGRRGLGSRSPNVGACQAAARVARKEHAAIDGGTMGVAGYEKSQKCRRIAEGINGWVKGVGRMAKTRFKGVMRSKSALMMYGAAYNLLRMSKLLAPA